MTADELLAAADQVKSIRTNATELGVDPDMAEAVGHQESRYNPAAVSPAGARGTMQVMPQTAKMLEPKYGSDNIRQGVGYLKDMSDLYPDLDETQRRHFALASYNAGPGRVASARRKAKSAGLDPNDFGAVSQYLPGETREYVPSIVKRIGQGSGQTQVTGEDDTPSADDLLALAGSAKPAAASPAAEPRSLGENLYDRTVGRVARGVDEALGGLPSTLAGVAGAMSAGDEEGVNEALAEGGGTGQRMLGVGSGLLQTGVTAALPGTSLLQAGVGTGTEALTGSKTAGDVAEIAAGVAPAAAGAVKGGIRGVRSLFKGPKVEEEITKGLGAGKTAQDVGHMLQAPGNGARGVISKDAADNSRLYQKAQEGLKTAGATVNPKPLARAARQAILDTKAAGGGLSGDAMRVVRNIRKMGVGKASKVLGPNGQPVVSGAASVGADELIEQQSNLRRVIGGLPGNHPARGPLLDLDDALEGAISGAAKKAPGVEEALGTARGRYRMTTIPGRKTMQRVTRAETPEGATRVLTSPKNPSRFGRFARSAKPGEAESVRSAHWTDMIGSSRNEDGSLDMVKLAKKIGGLDPKTLKQMADTPAKRMTIKALRRAARVQNLAKKAPVTGWAVGTASGGFLGMGAGYTAGRVLKSALTSETASRALFRAFQSSNGSAGRELAITALKKALKGVAPAVSAGVAAAEEE